MTLCEELYFEITAQGTKADLKKLVSFIKSGELDDFFEVDPDYLIYGDNYKDAKDSDTTEIVFTNDEYGIEIDEFDTDEFLEVFCLAAKDLDVYGFFHDIDEDEFHFTSQKGVSYYINSRKAVKFNDELDEIIDDEDRED